MNIQHPTSNIQHPVPSRAGRFIGCSVLDVGCWMFLPFIFFDLSLSAQTTTNVLPPLAPAYPEIPPAFWEQHGTAILAGGAMLVALAMLILWKLLQPKPAIIVSPEIVAREALTKLLRQPENGKLLSEVSQILRRYVIAAFELPAAELTTAEFCAALAASGKIGAELAGAISGFLRDCDERKFAPPGGVGVQASARSDNPSAIPGTLKCELQPAAARALALVALVEKATTGKMPVPLENDRRI